MLDPLFLVFLALSFALVAMGWLLVGKVSERRSDTIIEMTVEQLAPAAERELTAAKASVSSTEVPAPITRMVRVDVAEMHAEIEQFLREQSR